MAINTTGSPEILGDKSVSTNRVSVTSRRKGWADLDLSLQLHPIRNDITTLKDDNAIRNAVKNLLITNFYERPFNSSIGANLRALLFEPADVITKIAIREQINDTIKRYEPRVEVQDIKIQDDSKNNLYNITVNFLIKEFDTDQRVDIVLRRLR